MSARQVREIVRAEKARGRTILLSAHQMEAVERLCDRLLMLHRGKTVLYGDLAEVKARFAEGVVRVEHDDPTLDPFLPSGVAVRDAAPGMTHLMPPPDMPPRDLVAALLAAGARVRAFNTVTPSLEEIFVRIVGEKG